jgi:putative nucleotidyltransferase with HDIG domain
MESKQIVFCGLVATALFTAIALSGWAADIVVAFFILAAGILLTYYIALNQKRMEQSGHLWDLIKACQEIEQQNSIRESMEELARWSGRLLHVRHTMVWVAGENGFQAGDASLYPLLEFFRQKIEAGNSSARFHKSDNNDLAWPQGLNWLAVYPFPAAGGEDKEGRAVLLLADARPCEPDRQAREVLEVLGRHSAVLLGRWRAGQSDRHDEQILIRSLLAGMEAGDSAFLGHSERVVAVSGLIAGQLGLDAEEMKALEYSAWLHDIGKIAATAISKQQPGEDEVCSDHASLGADLIPATGIFKLVREAVRHHHERYDGGGPLGLSRTEIPFLARIIAVADIYDALTSLCPEEDKVDSVTAVKVIKKGSGTLFDPLVVVALEEALGTDDPTDS